MKRLLLITAASLLLCGCMDKNIIQSIDDVASSANVSSISNISLEDENEMVKVLDMRLTTFGTDLPTIEVDGVPFIIGMPAKDEMYSIIKPFYVSEDQYNSDLNAELLSFEGRKSFGEELTPEDDEYYSYKNMTRVVFGGQKDDGGFLAFTVTNLSAQTSAIKDCPVISVSFLYNDDLKERVTVNGKKIFTRDDMISLMGDVFDEQDVSEYGYIYTSKCSYNLESTANVTFLIDENDNVIGVQEGDFYYYVLYMSQYGGE